MFFGKYQHCLTYKISYQKRIKQEINKSTGADEILLNGIKNCFGVLSDIWTNVFDLSLEMDIFPDPLKNAKVTPVLKILLENIRAFRAQPT